MENIVRILLGAIGVLLGGAGGVLANGTYFRHFAGCVERSLGVTCAAFGTPLLISFSVAGIATIIFAVVDYITTMIVFGGKTSLNFKSGKYLLIFSLSTILSYLLTMIELWYTFDLMDRMP